MVVYIAFSNPKKGFLKLWFAKLIRYAQKSESDHVTVILETVSNTWAYEAVWPRSRKIKYSDWLELNDLHSAWSFEVPKEKQYEVIEYLESLVGKSYSLSQLLFIFLCKLVKPLNAIFRTAILNHERELICTELGARFSGRFFDVDVFESYDLFDVNGVNKLCAEMNLKRKWK